MYRWIGRVLGCEDGATTIEYGLIAALIFVAIMGAIALTADQTIAMWNNVANRVVATERK